MFGLAAQESKEAIYFVLAVCRVESLTGDTHISKLDRRTTLISRAHICNCADASKPSIRRVLVKVVKAFR